jgi:hypothetical protein
VRIRHGRAHHCNRTAPRFRRRRFAAWESDLPLSRVPEGFIALAYPQVNDGRQLRATPLECVGPVVIPRGRTAMQIVTRSTNVRASGLEWPESQTLGDEPLDESNSCRSRSAIASRTKR